MQTGIRSTVAALAVVLLAVSTRGAQASNHDTDWWRLPPYCRAKFLSDNFNYGYERWRSSVSPAEIRKWYKLLGRTSYTHVHHFCWATQHLARARAESDAHARRIWLDKALADAEYSLVRSDPRDLLYPEIVTLMGHSWKLKGNAAEAIRHFDLAISTVPDHAAAYALKSLVLRDTGDLDAAIEVLEEGVAATKGKNSELHYFLGLMLVKKKDYEAAVEHAKAAYGLGYPLPGLKNKLARLGHWKK